MAMATFSDGCFWCMQEPFDLLPGVIKTMQIIYSTYMISYEKLLKVFWHNIDPAEGNGQFCDKGNQYRAGIFSLGNRR